MASLETEFLERIEKHKGVIFKISKIYMSNIDDQKDLFQEIVYQCWKSYHTFENRSEFSTWLYRIALNTAIIFLKSEKRRAFVVNGEVEKFNIKQEDYAQEEEQKLKVMYEAIQQLNSIDKALIFYFLEDYSGRKIAEQMGISEVNVRVKLNRAKTKLKELINSKS